MMAELLNLRPPLPDLKRDLALGEWKYRADSIGRGAFFFSIGSYPIGIYAAQSIGPHALRLLRRWDQTKETRDLVSGLAVMNQGHQFTIIKPGDPMFFIEYTSDFEMVVGKVAFKAETVTWHPEVEIINGPRNIRIEGVDLKGIQILG